MKKVTSIKKMDANEFSFNQSNKKNDFLKLTKKIILPTAKILSNITYDKSFENANIKTTTISKIDNKTINSVEFSKSLNDDKLTKSSTKPLNILDEYNFKNDSINTTKFNEYLNNEKSIPSENGKVGDFGESEDILDRNNNNFNFDRDLVSYEDSINNNDHDKEIEHRVFLEKIEYIKNEREIKNLKVLLDEMASNLQESFDTKGKIIINSNKYDDSFIYSYIKDEYLCTCSNCASKQNADDFILHETNFVNLYSKDVIGRIEENKNIKTENQQDKYLDNAKESVKESEIIYSQSLINRLLLGTICQTNNEFDRIMESLNRKILFLNNMLISPNQDLSEYNKKNILGMIEKLNRNKKFFLENNKNFIS